jgi:hypothetical protein
LIELKEDGGRRVKYKTMSEDTKPNHTRVGITLSMNKITSDERLCYLGERMMKMWDFVNIPAQFDSRQTRDDWVSP